MKSLHNFIFYTDVFFDETFKKTESELELFGDNQFLQKRLAQREVEINTLHLNYEGEKIVGYRVFIDPTIYFQNQYSHGKGDTN